MGIVGECRRCGDCCNYNYQVMNRATMEYQGGREFYLGKGAEIMEIPKGNELRSQGKYLVRIPEPCSHFHMEDGVGRCDIYERRPPICTEHPHNAPEYFLALKLFNPECGYHDEQSRP